jgi:signal transduction histidine kinase
MKSKLFKLTLVQKILALVLAPFLLNGLWLVLLNQALAQKSQLMDEEQSQTKYLENLNHGFQLFYDATGKLFEYELTSDPAARQHSLASIKEFRELAGQMRVAANVSKRSKQDFEAIASLMEQELNSLPQEKIATDRSDAASFFLQVNQARRLLKKTAQNSSSIMLATQAKQKELEQLRLEEQRSSAALEYIVYGGFAVNLLLAAALAYFVIADFSRRLSILLENSQRLGKRLPMTEAPGENDELTALDTAMRDAADDLQQAFDFRASLMEMVAHDLRSPLQSSQISLEILTETSGDKLDERGFHLVEKLQANNGRLLAMIEDLLTIDRLDTGSLELDITDVSIRKVAADSVLTLGSLAAAAEVRIINRCGEEKVMADTRRLSQVFNNIISNAIKYSPQQSDVEITSSIDGMQVVVTVIDQGIGMTSAECKRIFEKFYQAGNAQKSKGFGLGLAICKLIIDSHGGTIGVDSSPNKGSRFWFSLPLA